MQPNDNNIPGDKTSTDRSPNPAGKWIVAGCILAGLAGVGYGVNSRREAAQTASVEEAGFKTTLTDMQQQMQVLQDRLAARERKDRERESAAAAAQQAAAAAAAPAPRPTGQAAPARKRTAAQVTAPRVDDPRFKQFEKQFSDQEEKLASTRDLVESTRSDLEDRINSSSSELKGSIAHTSEEVAALRRRGERDYFEFDMAKSKSIRRVGPVGVALRKADVKHKRYSLDMLVDDNRLEKKNVNLLEPVYITSPEWPQPVELVVNRIDKDRVRGYISTPKYKRSDLSTSGGGSDKPEAKPGGFIPQE